MMASFGSVEGLVDYLKYLSDEADKKSLQAKTQRDTQSFKSEQLAYLYVHDLILNSDLVKARLINNNDDLQDAKNEVALAIGQLNLVIDDLGATKNNLIDRLKELES